jgi:hypothetical protein
MPRTSHAKANSQPQQEGEQPAGQSERAQPEQAVSRQPDLTVHYGRVTASAWAREFEERTVWSVSVSRSYQDRDNKWVRTNSLDEGDLLAASKAIEDIYVSIQRRRQESRQGGLQDLQVPNGGQSGTPF